MVHFQRSTGRVSTTKSVRDPDWAALIAWKGPGKFELHTPSVKNRPFRATGG